MNLSLLSKELVELIAEHMSDKELKRALAKAKDKYNRAFLSVRAGRKSARDVARIHRRGMVQSVLEAEYLRRP